MEFLAAPRKKVAGYFLANIPTSIEIDGFSRLGFGAAYALCLRPAPFYREVPNETWPLPAKNALERWDDRREEVNQLRLNGKEIGGEPLHLQANYTKAYAELRKHVQDCEICQFLARTAGRKSDYTINFDSRKKCAFDELPQLSQTN